MQTEVSTAATTASPRHTDLGESRPMVSRAQGDRLPERTDSPEAHSQPRTLTWGRSRPAGPGTWGLAPPGPAVGPTR